MHRCFVQAEFGEQVKVKDERVEAAVGEVAVKVAGRNARESFFGALGKNRRCFGVAFHEPGLAVFEFGGGQRAGGDFLLSFLQRFADARKRNWRV